MKEFQESLRGLSENIWDLRKGLIMLLIILVLIGAAYYAGDFTGLSRINVVLTLFGFAALAFFNVHLVPYVAYKEAWKWDFLLLMIPVCIIGMCISSGYFYFSMSLILVGGLGTFIRLITYKSPIRL